MGICAEGTPHASIISTVYTLHSPTSISLGLHPPAFCLQAFFSPCEAKRCCTNVAKSKGLPQLNPQLADTKRFQAITVVTLQECTNVMRHVLNMQKIHEDSGTQGTQVAPNCVDSRI